MRKTSLPFDRASHPSQEESNAPARRTGALDRRTFLEFLGIGTVGFVLVPGLFSGCKPEAVAPKTTPYRITPLLPKASDALELAPGLNSQLLIRWNDPINATERFGFNNDFICYIPLDASVPEEGLLWVNHESVDPRFVSNWDELRPKTREQVTEEQLAVGGSILRVRKEDGQWQVLANDPMNRRVHGRTVIPFNWPHPIAGATAAVGTLANCSGGLTPWGHILTCEENYDQFYGENDPVSGLRQDIGVDQGWHTYDPFPPEHYGWVVEVNPRTGEAQKHIALGRCAHECATIHELPDARLVVYTGDDANDEHLYKFISSVPGSLSEGTLYAANLDKGIWEPIIHERPELRSDFADQTDVLIRLRYAAKKVNATPLDRPEDIEIDPVTGNVLVALTNNLPKGNYYGSILKIMEENGRHDALRFKHETYLAGGEETGFACPDNMAFDPQGNLWFTSDISGSKTNKEPYTAFGNNGLYVVPRHGEQAGQVIQVASAPHGAELTGPWFSPDGRSLFLSVQHPGENSPSMAALSSHWPDGGDSMPRPSVVVLSGQLLDQFSATATEKAG